MHFRDWKICISIKICLFLRFQLTVIRYWFWYCLAPNRRQAIIWTNADPVHWRIYAALWGDWTRPLIMKSLDRNVDKNVELSFENHRLAWDFVFQLLSYFVWRKRKQLHIIRLQKVMQVLRFVVDCTGFVMLDKVLYLYWSTVMCSS